MNRNKLFTTLNCLCNEMSNVYNINNGGCCFVAAVIAEQLELSKIPFKVAITYSPTHYAIKVSDRFINRDDYNFLPEELNSMSSYHLYNIYRDGDWNYRYSRRWNLIVKTRIKSVFRKYGNSV